MNKDARVLCVLKVRKKKSRCRRMFTDTGKCPKRPRKHVPQAHPSEGLSESWRQQGYRAPPGPTPFSLWRGALEMLKSFRGSGVDRKGTALLLDWVLSNFRYSLPGWTGCKPPPPRIDPHVQAGRIFQHGRPKLNHAPCPAHLCPYSCPRK